MKTILHLVTGLLTFTAQSAFSHGTVTSPSSRVYQVYLEGPDSASSPSAVAAIASAGSNPYYTWNQISQNVPSYNSATFSSSYASVIPDGQLASGANVAGSNLDFSGLDLVSNSWDWPATPVTAGPLDINWFATATHDPSYFKVWITTADYNHKTPLTWDKMEFLGQIPHTSSGQNYTIPITLPARIGRHVLYVAWQRIDPVGEVFFSASDLLFGDDPGTPEGDPVASITGTSTNEVDGTASIEVKLSKPVAVGESGSINFSTSNGSAHAGQDYTTTSGTLNFSSGQDSKTITVPIFDDAIEESSEVFTVSLDTPVDLVVGSSNATVTITDNDTVTVGGSSWETRDDWGSGYNGWLTLVNGTASALDTPTLTFSFPDDGRVVNVWGGPTVTNLGGGNFSVTGLGNIPGDGSIRIDIGVSSTGAGAQRAPTNVALNGVLTGTLPPAVSITPNLSLPEGDAADTLSLDVTLDQAHDSAVHVSYTTIDGSALAGTDYTAASGNLVYAIGELTKTISINYQGNTTPEADKSFRVFLSGVDGETPPRFASPTANESTITLEDDDAPPALTATGGIVMEGDSGTSNLTFRLQLARAAKAGETISVDYMAHGHGATAGLDFVPTTGTATFPLGSSTATVQVPIIGDTIDERLELLNLHFQNPVGLIMETTAPVGQIIDNEFDAQQLGNQRVVAYIDGTSGGTTTPPSNRVTHIMYAFANLASDGNLLGGAAAAGTIKSSNPSVKVLLSVGGWTWSGNFSAVAADAIKRETFAQSCRTACAAHNLDGIDLDWEWPGVNGGPGTVPNPADGANYTLLVQALRTELDDLEESTGKHYEITAFTAASPSGIAQLELSQLAPLFDFVNVQGYDLHGPWDSVTGHNAGLHHNSADSGSSLLNIEAILQQYLDGGFPRSKLLVGAPFFARRFYSVGGTANGSFQPHSGSGDTPLYRDLTSQLETIPRFWDAYARVPFLYDRESQTWISYDDPQAMHEKANFSRNNGFGGVFFWRNGGDTTDRQLLTTISDSLSAVDADHDDIDDAWELQHFGDLVTATSTSDFDQDGQTDFDESLFKTDPKDSASKGLLAPPTSTGGEVETQFDSKTGVLYQLQSSPNLKNWINSGAPIEGTGAVITLSPLPNTETPQQFYRIIVVK